MEHVLDNVGFSIRLAASYTDYDKGTNMDYADQCGVLINQIAVFNGRY
jgi:hypothetical protein